MTPDDDPFGRRGEDRTDAFGRPVEPPASGSLWSGPAEQAEPAAPPGPPEQRGFLPPTDAVREWTPPPQPSSPAVQGELAGYGERAGAAVVDFFVRVAIVLATTLVLAALFGGDDDAAGAGVLLGLYVIGPLYAPLAMTRWQGQTLGHRVVDTRIVTRTGEPVTGGKAFVREFLTKNVLVEAIGGLFTLGILPLLNYLWPLWDQRNEALHDKMCDTRVVKA